LSNGVKSIGAIAVAKNVKIKTSTISKPQSIFFPMFFNATK
jgi:hypothetical protein